MASEDSRKHYFQRSCAPLSLPVGVHLIHETNDPSESCGIAVLTTVHCIEDFLESLEGARLATERDNVPLEERYDLLAKSRGRRDLVHEYSWAPALGSYASAVEGYPCELEDPATALVLIQEKSRINVVPRTARRMVLDAHTEGAFTLDEARKEPVGFGASESFLLIVRTRHVFTIVNVRSDVTMSSAGFSDVPAYSRIL